MTKRWATTAVVVFAAAAAGVAQGTDPYAGLKAYDFTNRAPVFAVRQMIKENLSDRDKLAGIETGLIGVLNDPAATFGGKQEACRMLWEIGTARSIPALAKLLTDEKLSDDARYGLERNADPAAGRALRDALKTARDNPLIGLINSVGDRADAEAVGSLSGLTTNSGPLVASAAVAALGKIGTLDALKALEGLPGDDPFIARAKVHAAERLTLAGKKKDAERVYLELASSGPMTTQAAALRGLMALGSTRAAPIALADLKSSDTEVQAVAAGVVTALGTDSDLHAAVAAYPGLPITAQTPLLAGLAARGDREAVPFADQAIQSTDGALRTVGVRAAALLEGPNSVPALARLASMDGPLKNTARESLVNLPGNAADQAILQLARSGEPSQRAALVGILADRGSPAYRATLIDAARGADEKVAVAAVKSLGQDGNVTDLPSLVSVLKTTGSDTVRDTAVTAVTAIAQRSGNRDAAAQPVADALAGATPAARASLISTLAEIGGDRALAEVTKAAASTDPDVKAAAVTALAESESDPRALPALWNLAKSDADKATRVQSLRGYLRLLALDDRMPAGEKVGDVKAAMGIAERPEEKRQALGVLRDCRTPAAVDLAASSLTDPALFNESADAVLNLAAPQKKGRLTERAIKGPATTAALDKIIQLSTDDAQKARAQKLR
jgi:HEAT repeat protein